MSSSSLQLWRNDTHHFHAMFDLEMVPAVMHGPRYHCNYVDVPPLHSFQPLGANRPADVAQFQYRL
jgi:hypothetical protein